ncbi:MAG: hypothetical protein ACXVCY_10755 [Pseudobdellovibrionaceae bacterium]
MSAFQKTSFFISTLLIISLLSLQDANAAGHGGGGGASKSLSGDMFLGVGISNVSAGQNDLNGVIDTAGTSAGANTKDLTSAWDIYVNWGIRFSGTPYAFILRPSLFMQKTTGTGTGGDYNYGLTGFTLFPIFRVYPLENAFIKFYMQGGLGYGSLSGDITAGAKTLQFSGNGFGAMGGIGVDFCFTDVHCLTIEGNLRYMPIQRNVTTGGNCSASGDIPGISQCGGSSEVERNGSDLQTTMSGVQGVVGYTMNF